MNPAPASRLPTRRSSPGSAVGSPLGGRSPGSRHAVLVATAFLAVLAFFAAVPGALAGQMTEEGEVPERLAVFLDCTDWCQQQFIRQELTYVDWVRDREVADVHVLVTEEDTGAGGEAQTFDLIGLGVFEGMDYSTVYTTTANSTQAEERDGFLQTLQAVLVPYMMQTSMGPQVRVAVEEAEAAGPAVTQPVDDPWDYWTIEFYADGSADFESRQQALDTRWGVYVGRVSEDWKIQFRPFFNYNYDRFERGEEDEEEIIRSNARRNGFTTYAVKSVSPHWSVGAFADAFTSTFDNVEWRYRFMPAVEWSLFPYREATRRQLTVAYRIGASHITYRDTTIYEETQELLPEHTLTAEYEVTQPWGEVDIGLNASQYLQDLDFYSLSFDGSIDVRITQGLSIELGADVAFIQNQLNLPKGDANLEEVLLRRRQLETNYEAGLSFGFRYRFGSIYNNVVNTRFGGGPNQDRF